MKSGRGALLVILLCALLAMLISCAGETPKETNPPKITTIAAITTGSADTSAVTTAEGTTALDTTATKSTAEGTIPVTTPVTSPVTTAPAEKLLTVRFETNGGEEIKTLTVKKGESVSVPTTALKDAEFDGWYFDRAYKNKVEGESFTVEGDTTLFAKWIKDREIRLYTSETEYTSLYYREGTTVDISEWKTPAPITFKGYSCDFKHWINEQFTSVLTEDFEMPARSLAFYAIYEDIKTENNFYVLGEGDEAAYESVVANAMTTVDGIGGKYGKWEVTVTETNKENTRLGIFVNASIADSKKYAESGSGHGLYFHHSVQSNTRFVLVDYYDGYRALIGSDLRSVSYASSGAYTSALKGGGLEKYYKDNEALKRGEAESLTFTMAVEVLPYVINLYVNGECIGSYDNTDVIDLFALGGEYGGKTLPAAEGVGFTTNSAGTVFSDLTFTPAVRIVYDLGGVAENAESYAPKGQQIGAPVFSRDGIKINGWYSDKALTKPLDPSSLVSEGMVIYADAVRVESVNNFYVYTDKNGTVYEAMVSNAMTTVDGIGGKYGKWEVTVSEKNSANIRLGLFLNASIPDGKKYGAADSGYGFYLHHNVSANSRFVLVDYYNRYQGINAKDYLSASYTASSGAEGGGIRKYRADNLALKNGEIDELVFTMAVEVTPEKISLFLNGELLGSMTDKSVIDMFTVGGEYGGKTVTPAIGVGFTTSSAGTRFSNLKFTSYGE